MASMIGPNITTSGLILNLDSSNNKSFRGDPATNLLTSMGYSLGTIDTALFKSNYGSEYINVPGVGMRTVHYCNIYNDYNGGSGACCPAPFAYGDITVLSNTVYTYQLIYKTTTGYASANYMYHYEYNGGTYVTEYGLLDGGRIEDMGDGWKHAWGTFTSNASTNRFICSLFHYEYATQNKIQVAGVMITQRSTPLPYKHFIDLSTTRGSTFATGGGWQDLSGNNNHAETAGTVPYGSSYNGYIETPANQIVNYIILPESAPQSLTNGLIFSIDWWSTMKNADAGRYQMSMVNSGGANLFIIGKSATDFSIYACTLLTGSYPTYTVDVPQHLCVTSDGSNQYFYKNGELTSTWSAPLSEIKSTAGFVLDQEQDSAKGSFDPNQNTYGWWSSIKMYNKTLSSTEVLQNFNATKTRFGL